MRTQTHRKQKKKKKAFLSFAFFPCSQRTKRFGGVLSTRPRLWGMLEEGGYIAHALAHRAGFARLRPGAAARRALRAHGPPGLGAAQSTAYKPRTTRAPSCPSSPSPTVCGVPVGGRLCSPRSPRRGPSCVQPSRNRSPRAALQTGDPSVSCRRRGARSLRSLPPRSGYRLMKCSFSSVICFVFLQSSDK